MPRNSVRGLILGGALALVGLVGRQWASTSPESSRSLQDLTADRAATVSVGSISLPGPAEAPTCVLGEEFYWTPALVSSEFGAPPPSASRKQPPAPLARLGSSSPVVPAETLPRQVSPGTQLGMADMGAFVLYALVGWLFREPVNSSLHRIRQHILTICISQIMRAVLLQFAPEHIFSYAVLEFLFIVTLAWLWRPSAVNLIEQLRQDIEDLGGNLQRYKDRYREEKQADMDLNNQVENLQTQLSAEKARHKASTDQISACQQAFKIATRQVQDAKRDQHKALAQLKEVIADNAKQKERMQAEIDQRDEDLRKERRETNRLLFKQEDQQQVSRQRQRDLSDENKILREKITRLGEAAREPKELTDVRHECDTRLHKQEVKLRRERDEYVTNLRKSYEKTVRELEEKHQEAITASKARDGNIDDLTTKNASLTSNIADLKRSIENQQRHNTEQQKTINGQKATISKQQSELQKATSVTVDVEKRLQNSLKQVAELTTTNTLLTQQMHTDKTTISLLNGQIGSTQPQLQKSTETDQAQAIVRLQAEIGEQKTALAAANKSVREGKARLQEQELKHQEQCTIQQDTINTLHRQAIDRNTQLKQVQTINQQMQIEGTSLLQQVQDQTELSKRLEEQVRAQSAGSQDHGGEIREQEQNAERQSAENLGRGLLVDQWRAKIEMLEKENHALKAGNEQIGDLKEQVAEFQAQLRNRSSDEQMVVVDATDQPDDSALVRQLRDRVEELEEKEKELAGWYDVFGDLSREDGTSLQEEIQAHEETKAKLKKYEEAAQQPSDQEVQAKTEVGDREYAVLQEKYTRLEASYKMMTTQVHRAKGTIAEQKQSMGELESRLERQSSGQVTSDTQSAGTDPSTYTSTSPRPPVPSLGRGTPRRIAVPRARLSRASREDPSFSGQPKSFTSADFTFNQQG